MNTGIIYSGTDSHRGLKHKYGIVFSEESKLKKPESILCIPGFLHDDGRFFDRKQAADYYIKHGGVPINENELMSGEEWITPIKSVEDAVDLRNHFHPHGARRAEIRISIFEAKRIHYFHVYLLKIVLGYGDSKWQ